MELSTLAFKNKGKIPLRFTGEGVDLSPELRWSGVSPECRELALICEDPDAPRRPGKDHPFVHWVAYNIPVSVSYLPEGLNHQKRLILPVSIDQGKNSFGKIGYSGPLPPSGDGVHHYIFTLYALNQEIGLAPGFTKAELMIAIKDHVIEVAEWIGTYQRIPLENILAPPF